jgi:hypothetical protein
MNNIQILLSKKVNVYYRIEDYELLMIIDYITNKEIKKNADKI